MEKRVKDVGLRNNSLRSKMKELNEDLEAVCSQIEASHRKHRELLRVLEVRKEEKAELLGNRYKLFIGKMDTVMREKYINIVIRGILELKLQSIMSDRKHLHKTHFVQLREQNRYRIVSSK